MGGPRPIAYTPLGELMVFVFFGLIAVVGSGYIQIGAVTPALATAGAAIGSLAAAVLVVNNHRTSRTIQHGRRTFGVRFGAHAHGLYAVLMLAPFALVRCWSGRQAATCSGCAARPAERRRPGACHAQDATGLAFNGLLMRTVMLQLIYGAMLTIGTLLAAWL